MRSRLFTTLALAALLAAGVLFAGCGDHDHTDVTEGVPLELGDLTYNVAITRFLNPDDVEDTEYLVGQKPAPEGKSYLATFIKIENDGDAVHAAGDFKVEDTTGAEYLPIVSRSPYALGVGAQVEPGGELPVTDTTAATGPIEGSMILFLVDQDVSDNRPLTMTVTTPAGKGEVQLDI